MFDSGWPDYPAPAAEEASRSAAPEGSGRIEAAGGMIDSLVPLSTAIDGRMIEESTDRTENNLGPRRAETPVTACRFGSPGWANVRMFCPTPTKRFGADKTRRCYQIV